jgi:hypothetical protein
MQSVTTASIMQASPDRKQVAPMALAAKAPHRNIQPETKTSVMNAALGDGAIIDC